jgi:aminoglycoside phosphotransferase (APT) family kinase protein
VAKVREDLMSDSFSSIWLEVGFPGRTRFLVCNIYRDWQYLGQDDHSSLDISEQLARWIIFMEQWERALDTGRECIVMGDFNLDFLSFHRTDPSTSSQPTD